jgi:aarF domain-containing kinase
MSKLGKFGKISLVFAGTFGYDYLVNEQAFFRNFRTVGAALRTVIDYKIFFNEDNISQMHAKVAERLLHVCRKNGGLYIKFGQGMIDHFIFIFPQELLR